MNHVTKVVRVNTKVTRDRSLMFPQRLGQGTRDVTSYYGDIYPDIFHIDMSYSRRAIVFAKAVLRTRESLSNDTVLIAGHIYDTLGI